MTSALSENGYYGSDREVVSLAERLINRTLPKPEWTHEALRVWLDPDLKPLDLGSVIQSGDN